MIAIRPDTARAISSPRETPVPPRFRFSELLTQGAASLMRSAETAITSLPGGPVMAVAVRGGLGSSASPAVPTPRSLGTAEGPSPTSDPTQAVSGVEGSLRNAQEMNLYYLEVQERVNAQNRTFSTLSNVLKAEHETVKTAIANIR